MALFRKSKKSNDSANERRARLEAERNQSKWDELERLVSDTEPSFEASLSENITSTSSSSPAAELESLSVSETELDDLASDLSVDIPDDSELEEINISPSASVASTATALAASSGFDKNTRSGHSEVEQSSQTSAIDDFVPSPPAVSRPDRADIGAMRLDVARISADIQSGEELYRRAQQRIENLTGFVERAEVDFSMLNRLEPENRRLKARNRTLERELEANEKSRSYETTLGKLSTAQKALQEYERALNTTRESSDRNALNSERLQTSLDVERRENEVLRERVATISSDMSVKQNDYIEAKKVADSLAQDCSDLRHDAQTSEKEITELRQSLATAQTQNNAMKSEMLSLHEDIRTFKSQSEFTIISREDEMTALQSQVAHLTKQLEIKDDIVRNAETQSYQLDQANTELLKTKQDVTDFDRRYRDVATALSVSQARRQNNAPAENPDIQPQDTFNPALSNTAAKAADIDDFDRLTDDEISDRIMDFRLGLRSDIT